MKPGGDFENEALLDLRDRGVRDSLTDALASLDRELPIDVPVLIGNELRSEPAFESTDPSRTDRLVAVAASSSESDADRAVAQAEAASAEWGGRPPEARAEVLVRAADLMRADRMRLAALAVRVPGGNAPVVAPERTVVAPLQNRLVDHRRALDAVEQVDQLA